MLVCNDRSVIAHDGTIFEQLDKRIQVEPKALALRAPTLVREINKIIPVSSDDGHTFTMSYKLRVLYRTRIRLTFTARSLMVVKCGGSQVNFLPTA